MLVNCRFCLDNSRFKCFVIKSDWAEANIFICRELQYDVANFQLQFRFTFALIISLSRRFVFFFLINYNLNFWMLKLLIIFKFIDKRSNVRQGNLRNLKRENFMLILSGKKSTFYMDQINIFALKISFHRYI